MGNEYMYFESQREWVEKLLMELLSIRSESGDEQEAVEYMHGIAQDLGAEVELVPISGDIAEDPEYSDPVKGLKYVGRYNLSVEKAGAGGKVIAINSHLDVVPPSPGQIDPYSPQIDCKGFICARGACDAKGQIAVMALVLKAACELPQLKNSIVCHMVIEEELGGNGTLALLRAKPDFTADALINMEPTDLALCTSIRGAVWFDMTFTGATGHAGSAANTESAMDKAIAAIALLKDYHAELYERSKDYGLFKGMNNPMPLTIGEFQSGVWPSMVPGSARIAGLIGILPNVTKADVMRDLKELFSRPENKWISEEGMSLHFPYRHNAVELPTDHAFARGMMDAMTQCGLESTPRAMTASTDAIFYQELGIPSLAFGPGRLADAHSCHERIAVNDIVKAAEVIYRFAKEA